MHACATIDLERISDGMRTIVVEEQLHVLRTGDRVRIIVGALPDPDIQVVGLIARAAVALSLQLEIEGRPISYGRWYHDIRRAIEAHRGGQDVGK